MTTELQEALARAANDASTDFEARDAMDVITPTARRVRRHRTRVTVVTAVGSVMAIGGLLWGADAIGTSRAVPVAPAAPSAPGETEAPDSNDIAGGTPWSTVTLAAVTQKRAPGETREDAVAGMICHHAAATDDPRVLVANSDDPTVSHATTIEDCTPVWFLGGPITSDVATTVSFGTPGRVTITAQSFLTNTSARPIEIDEDSVFMWIETAPDEAGEGVITSYSRLLMGTSMWDDSGDNMALLDSAEKTLVVAPDEQFNLAITSTETTTGGPLSGLLSEGEPFTVTLWARVHEENPAGDASYLIQLGPTATYNLDYSWSHQ